MNPLAKAPPGSIVAHLETLPISRFTLALFCGASGDHNPLHVDTDFARAAGHEDVFAHGMLVMAYMGRLLPRRDARLQVESFTCRFASMTQVGDALICAARLETREVVGSQLRVRLTLDARTAAGTLRASGQAVVVFDDDENVKTIPASE
jgi:acyl dehydratase